MSPAQAPHKQDTAAYPAQLLPSLPLQQQPQQPAPHLLLLLRCQWCGLLLLSWLLLLPLLLLGWTSWEAWAAQRLVLQADEGRGRCCCCTCGRKTTQCHTAACCSAEGKQRGSEYLRIDASCS
jgi:hypothetical protein